MIITEESEFWTSGLAHLQQFVAPRGSISSRHEEKYYDPAPYAQTHFQELLEFLDDPLQLHLLRHSTNARCFLGIHLSPTLSQGTRNFGSINRCSSGAFGAIARLTPWHQDTTCWFSRNPNLRASGSICGAALPYSGHTALLELGKPSRGA
jgi:hypothetical protein